MCLTPRSESSNSAQIRQGSSGTLGVDCLTGWHHSGHNCDVPICWSSSMKGHAACLQCCSAVVDAVESERLAILIAHGLLISCFLQRTSCDKPPREGERGTEDSHLLVCTPHQGAHGASRVFIIRHRLVQVCSVLRDCRLPTSLRACCAELLSLITAELRQAHITAPAGGAARQALLTKLQRVVQREVGSAAAQAIMQDMHATGDWQLLGSHMQTASLSAVALAAD